MKFIKKFDSFNSAKSNDLYSPMVVKIDDADQTALAIGKLDDVDKDTPVGILDRFKTLNGFKSNIESDFERGFGDIGQKRCTAASFDDSALSLSPSSEATCLFINEPTVCAVYVGEYDWLGIFHCYRWIVVPNTFIEDNPMIEQLKATPYYLLTLTRDFSSVSNDNPYTSTTLIVDDKQVEDGIPIILGTAQDDQLSLVYNGMSYTKDESLKHHDTSTLNANGYEYVDLGLPSGTLWATMNVGANTETEYGSYFTWGDSTVANDLPCDWNTYKFGDLDSSDSLTKYTDRSDFPVYDELLELVVEDDMVHTYMGEIGSFLLKSIFRSY